MNVREWRAAQAKRAAATEGEPLTLPSGLSVMARRPDPQQLMIWGYLPLGLASDGLRAETPSAEERLATLSLMRELLLYCLISPRVSLNPMGDDEISPREIDDEDLRFIVGWAMRSEEVEKLRPFRRQRTNADSGDDGEGAGSAAVGAAGDDRSVSGAGVGSGDDSGTAPR
jgi:hypothetical protein